MIWLTQWYQKHCNVDWEYGSGVHIGIIDNLGWSLSVNLEGAEVEMKKFVKLDAERSQNNWVVGFIRDNRFEGRCGSDNLLEILHTFREWIES